MLTTQPTWTQFLFSPRGRFNRARYWGATCLVYGVMMAYAIPAIVQDATFNDTHAALVTVYVVVGAVLFLAVVWIHICTIIKRFHDRDKAWFWVFMVFAPYIGGLWIFVECGCLSGTRGHNRFGVDPLNPLDIADIFGGPTRAVAEPRLPTSFGVTSQDRLG